MKAILGFVLAVGFFVPMYGSAQAVPSHAEEVQRAHDAAQALVALYDKQTGVFRTMGWWNSANAITELADESRVDPKADYRQIFLNTFDEAQHKNAGFINRFYDDEGWWALAWIDVYELHGGEKNLQMAESIFEDMTTGWDDTCGGGIWWNKDRRYKNAIANELFIEVAAKLALHTKGAKRTEYLKWANRDWGWLNASGMINSRSLINDGLDKECKNNHQPEWTYMQGVLPAALADMSVAEHDDSLLKPANSMALSALEHLTDKNGILHDPCEPTCKQGGDGVQFKGIMLRDISHLQQISPHEEYVKAFQVNADSIWTNARTPDDHFSSRWAGPPEDDRGGALGSALDALTAAAGKSK